MKTITIHLTDEQADAITATAKAVALPTAQWVRMVALDAAWLKGPIDLPKRVRTARRAAKKGGR